MNPSKCPKCSSAMKPTLTRASVIIDICTQWGQDLDPADCMKLGLPPSLANWTETDRGFVHPEKDGKIWVGTETGGKLIAV